MTENVLNAVNAAVILTRIKSVTTACSACIPGRTTTEFLFPAFSWNMNMNHPGIVLLAMVVVFAGIAVTVAAASLSHLVSRAADLQEQSDLTI